eukprot:symbB.v1.2.039401.t1/scaffold6533.1/size17332/1
MDCFHRPICAHSLIAAFALALDLAAVLAAAALGPRSAGAYPSSLDMQRGLVSFSWTSPVERPAPYCARSNRGRLLWRITGDRHIHLGNLVESAVAHARKSSHRASRIKVDFDLDGFPPGKQNPK